MKYHKKVYTEHPALYLWFVCIALHFSSILIPDLGDISFYGVSLLVSFAIYVLVNNVNGMWQVGPILWIEAIAMWVYFWAGVDGEYKHIGFWHANLETMIGILNSLELILLMSMVPWRDAWRKLTSDGGSNRMAFGDGQMSILGIDQRNSPIQSQEIK